MIPLPSVTCRHLYLELLTSTEDRFSSPTLSRVYAISVLVDDGAQITEHTFTHDFEPFVLSQFWDLLHPEDRVIGLDGLDEMLDFIRQRSLILGITPADEYDLRKWYSHETTNVLLLWQNWVGLPRPNLLTVPDALDEDKRHRNALARQALWSVGDSEALQQQCRDVVRLAYEAWLCLTFQVIPDRYFQCETVHEDLLRSEPVVRTHE